MTVLRASLAATALALLLFAAGAQAAPTDQIKLPARGTISPEGWALTTVTYSCAPRAGETYIVSNFVQSDVASFEDFTAVRCDRKVRQAVVVSGADFGEPFVRGPAAMDAAFYNFATDTFTNQVSGTVTLR